MKNKWIYKIIIVASIVMSITTSFGEVIYEETDETRINSGTVHKRLLILDGKTWRNVNVLEVDLTDENTGLKLLRNNDGIKNRLKLKENVDESIGVIGAINGDFFDTSTKAVLGPLIENGDIITSHISEKGFSNIVISGKTAEIVDNYVLNMRFINRKSNASLPVFYINKPFYKGDTVVLYNSYYDDKTIGYTGKYNIIEYIVENNIIKEIRYNEKAALIPKDGYVISAVGKYMDILTKEYAVGDKVDFVYNSYPSVNVVDMVFGSGPIILKDGNVPEYFDMNIKGSHPRTAIGISEDRKTMYLVTVDGRDKSYTGVSQEYLGEILKKLGAYNGVNLDGGGSTEMVVKYPGMFRSEIVNIPSDGSERLLVNGIGIINKGEPSIINGIDIVLDDDNVFLDTRRKISIRAYDENYNSLIIEDYKVIWSVEGIDGDFENGFFLPKSTGRGVIKASYDGFEIEREIFVVDNIRNLEITPQVFSGDFGDKINVKSYVKNVNGYMSKIRNEDLSWSIPEGVGHFDEEGFFIIDSKDSKGTIKVSFKDKSMEIPYIVGHKEIGIEKFENNPYEFLRYPENVSGSSVLVKDGFEGSSLKLTYDFTKAGGTRAAYIDFGEKIRLDEIPDKLAMMVKGDYGNNHWLRAIVEDDSGKKYYVDFHQNIDWEGWKYVSGKLPDVSGEFLQLNRVYLVETDGEKRDEGYIEIDNLVAVYNKEYIIDKIESINPIEEKFVNKDGDKIIIANKADTREMDLDSIHENLVIKEFENTIIHGADSSKGSLIKTNPYQLKKILSYFQESSSNIVICFNGSFPGTDREEVELIFNQVKKNVNLDNREVWFVFKSKTDDFEYDIKNGIYMLGIPEKKSIRLNICNEGIYLEKVVE
ncbi:MAG: phosphodiester glycosidase family protein [Firmicutes bacterium]|jgi:hypothetical protein|nr:phosphodiester glycosidase family protein [Bacillota bacterium]